jgi:hypothetical protein
MNAQQIITSAAGRIEWKDNSGKAHWAEFASTNNAWALTNDLPFEVLFSNTGAIRFARILKTVVRVAVDEMPDGTAKVEKWNCRTIFYKKSQ